MGPVRNRGPTNPTDARPRVGPPRAADTASREAGSGRDAVGSAPSSEDAADGAHRGPWRPPPRFEFPADRLGAVKQPLLLETLAARDHCLFQLAARAPGALVWPSGPLPKPLGIARPGTSQPLVEPLSRVAHRGADRRRRLPGQRSLDSAAAIALLLPVHACLRCVWRQSTVHRSPPGSYSRPLPMSCPTEVSTMSWHPSPRHSRGIPGLFRISLAREFGTSVDSARPVRVLERFDPHSCGRP